MWKGQPVPLVPRVEAIRVGKFGTISSTRMVTLYDVPHHGPIIPRFDRDHTPLPLGASELSIRYTGYEVTQEVRALLGVDRAKSAAEAISALDKDFKHGGQNWVVGDLDGHYGWTTATRLPRRPMGVKPFFVVPGDGSADWQGDVDVALLPRDYDPPRGFIVTANNDPVGVTDGNDPLSGPFYLAARYDPGVRAGRITTRLDAQATFTRDDQQNIQADSYSGVGSRLATVVIASVKALVDERKTPGTHKDLTALAMSIDDAHAAALADALARLSAWTFETPSATDGESPAPAEIADSVATSIWNAFAGRMVSAALDDELSAMGGDRSSDGDYAKALLRMLLHPDQLASGIAPETGDARLWDDLGTPGVIESKHYIIGKAMLATLDYLAMRLGPDPTAWRWGRLHHLVEEGVIPLDSIRLPPPNDPSFPDGFPRHGDNLAVDASNTGASQTDFDYHDGPAIRFVCELDPQTGPRAVNVLPGGIAFDPNSPHYRDMMERWRKNQAIELHYKVDDVVANGVSRTRFAPVK